MNWSWRTCGKWEEWEEERWRIKDWHGEGTGNSRERSLKIKMRDINEKALYKEPKRGRRNHDRLDN